ncbi:unnamed protein product [Notodromas monacha]|uniref:Chitin-binding type-2 domain-containing protein n=1 Tax=Notodromas monacha TaxID=399045 RepID=A0A7R9BRG9_9CRUS|nr:unnamed protein product [Notodromas monacha]CAG0920000.1 unnamed protein product [Notodromas monacha]
MHSSQSLWDFGVGFCCQRLVSLATDPVYRNAANRVPICFRVSVLPLLRGVPEQGCYAWAMPRGRDPTPLKSPGCPYRFGIFPIDSKNCTTTYYKCAFGIPEEQKCQIGLAYDNRIHQCNWPDLTPHCDPETIVGFSCPEKLPPGSLAVKFMPFPRFDAGRCDSLIVCVNGYPRLIRCTEEKVFNKLTLSCDYAENVPECGRKETKGKGGEEWNQLKWKVMGGGGGQDLTGLEQRSDPYSAF